MKRDRKEIVIIVLAYFNRYVFPVGGMMLSFLFMNESLKLLPTGIFLWVFALYELVGYLLRFKHIYCSYQDAYHQKMTPHHIQWGDVKKSDAYGVPAIFAFIGTAAILYSLL